MSQKKRIEIKCDYATQQRIIQVFVEETDFCFFGHGICGAYKTNDGPDCRKCILERAGWEITDKPGEES